MPTARAKILLWWFLALASGLATPIIGWQLVEGGVYQPERWRWLPLIFVGLVVVAGVATPGVSLQHRILAVLTAIAVPTIACAVLFLEVMSRADLM